MLLNLMKWSTTIAHLWWSLSTMQSTFTYYIPTTCGSGAAALIALRALVHLLRRFLEIYYFFTFLFLNFRQDFFIYSPAIGDKCCFIFCVATHNWWVYHRLNAFELDEMVNYNCTSLMIAVNNAKYVHPVHLFNFLEPLHFASTSHS